MASATTLEPDARWALRRVGAVVIVYTLATLAWEIRQASETHEFSFDFTVGVAGVALLFGSTSFAAMLRRMAAFGLGVAACFTPYWLLSQPLSLLAARLRFDPAQTAEDWLSYLGMMALAAWVVRELGKPLALPNTSTGRWSWVTAPGAFAGGVALGLFLAIFMLFQTHAEAGGTAVAKARAMFGAGMHYHLSALSIDHKDGRRHVEALVAAWNDKIVVDVPVVWDE